MNSDKKIQLRTNVPSLITVLIAAKLYAKHKQATRFKWSNKSFKSFFNENLEARTEISKQVCWKRKTWLLYISKLYMTE